MIKVFESLLVLYLGISRLLLLRRYLGGQDDIICVKCLYKFARIMVLLLKNRVTRPAKSLAPVFLNSGKIVRRALR